jgi:hypothetical protein
MVDYMVRNMNTTNTTATLPHTTTIPAPPPFNDWIFLYGCGPLSLASLILTTLCFLIFSSSEFKQMSLFGYLRLECAFMALDMLIKVLVIFIDRPNWPLWPTLFAQMFYTYGFIFASSVFEFCALASNVCASLVCLSMITPTDRLLARFAAFSPYLVMLGWFIFSILLFFYQAVSRNVFPIAAFVESSRVLGIYLQYID